MGKLSLNHLLFFLTSHVLFFNGNGLTIKLIQRDSPESPLYKHNLTETQKTKNLILQSKARFTFLAGNTENRNPNTTRAFEPSALRSRVENLQNSAFLAKVRIGTFGSGGIPYFLHMDTGSGLTWTQCEGCRSSGRHCFHQNQIIFPDSRSHSFHRLPCDQHPLCFPGRCLQNSCTYRVNYHDHASSEGFLATETFTFSGDSSPETVPGMVFGCGFDQRNTGYSGMGKIAGIMGLGWGPHSMPAQLGARGELHFSYCLSKMNSQRASYLRFGSEVPSRSGLRTTDLVQLGFQQPYYVNLIDISVANQRLRIPVRFFSRRSQDHQIGVVFDSGSTYSFLVQPAYDMLERAVANNLVSRIPGLTRVRVPNFLNLCYMRPISRTMVGFRDLPRLTFHFSGNVDMVVRPEAAFHVEGARREKVCLAVMSSASDSSGGGFSIIGAYQQTNQRIIFDVARKELHFGPEDCAANG